MREWREIKILEKHDEPWKMITGIRNDNQVFFVKPPFPMSDSSLQDTIDSFLDESCTCVYPPSDQPCPIIKNGLVHRDHEFQRQ